MPNGQRLWQVDGRVAFAGCMGSTHDATLLRLRSTLDSDLPTPGRLVIQQSSRNKLRARSECRTLERLRAILTALGVPDQNLCMQMNAEPGRSKRSIHHH